MPVRLIAIDLDGTMLTSDRAVHPSNVEAVQRAVEAGITIVLASGRIRPSMTPFVRELGLGTGPLICSNGAHIVDAAGELLAVAHLHDDIRESVIDYALREGLHINGYSTDEMFYIEDDAWSELYRRRAKTIPAVIVSVEELRSMKLVKLILIASPQRIKALAAQSDELFDTKRVTLTESEPEYLEFLPYHANKGAALSHLCKHLGVDQAAVMAIGDYVNDVEMVAWAGHGVAMGNAVAEVKAVANAVTATNDEGGVAQAINSVLEVRV